jgi:hypothetical protein
MGRRILLQGSVCPSMCFPPFFLHPCREIFIGGLALISPQVLTQASAFVSAYEAQLLVTAVFKGSSETFDAASIQHMLQEVLSRFGDMKSYQNLNDNEPGVVRIVVEFFDTRESDDALQALRNYKLQVSSGALLFV